MNTTKMKSKIKGLGIIFVLVFGIMLMTGTATSAQDYRNGRYDNNGRDNERRHNDDRYDNNRSNRYRQAMERGYRDGYQLGLADGRRHRRSDMYGMNQYRNPSNGYTSGWGSRGGFEQAYREGFSRGYREGFNKGSHERRGRHGGFFDF